MRNQRLVLPTRRRFIQSAGLLGVGALLNSQLDAIAQQPARAESLAQVPRQLATPTVKPDVGNQLTLNSTNPNLEYPVMCGRAIDMYWSYGSLNTSLPTWIGLFPEGHTDYSVNWGSWDTHPEFPDYLGTTWIHLRGAYPGSWMLRLFNAAATATSTDVARYGPFTIGPGLFVTPTTVPAGTIPRVDWYGVLNPNAYNWIGCRQQSPTNGWQTYGWWYAQNADGSAAQNGSVYTYWGSPPTRPGDYEFCVFSPASVPLTPTAGFHLS